MKLDSIIHTKDNGQEAIAITPHAVYNKTCDATDLTDTGCEKKDTAVSVNINNAVGQQDASLKKTLLALLLRLVSCL
jgi:hypothetical protein